MTHKREVLNGAENGLQRNPLEVFSVWFEDLPLELQTELASLISTIVPELVPGNAEVAALDEDSSLLRRALRADGESLVVAARASALSAVIDLIFLQRSTQEAWLLYRDSLEQFRDEALGAGKKAAARLLQTMIDGIPRRCALWMSQAQRWRTLRSEGALGHVPRNHGWTQCATEGEL